MREAKHDGHKRSEALKLYHYYKSALGDTPKRGQFKKFKHWVKEALAPAPAPKPKVVEIKTGGGGGADRGGGSRGTGAGIDTGGVPDWVDAELFEEDEQDVYGT
jgi:hypothetical protein